MNVVSFCAFKLIVKLLIAGFLNSFTLICLWGKVGMSSGRRERKSVTNCEIYLTSIKMPFADELIFKLISSSWKWWRCSGKVSCYLLHILKV